MDTLIFSVLFAVIAFVAVLAARLGDRRILVVTAAACAVYLGLDDFVTGLPTLFKGLDFVPGNWNWSGKIFSLGLSIVAIVALRISPETVGLTLKQRHPTVAALGILLFIVWGTCLGLLFKPGSPDVETLAFQATMPGLAEEIAYRGIAPVLLLGLVNRKPHVEGIPWAVVLSTSLLFGLWHSLSYADGEIGFDIMSGLFPFIGSVPGGWLRFKTKSLAAPVLGHSLANVAFHIAGGFGT